MDGDEGEGRRQALRWTARMEEAYDAALATVGGLGAAKPKAVYEAMAADFPNLTLQNVKWHLAAHRRREERLREMGPSEQPPPTKWAGRLEEAYEAAVAAMGGLQWARPKALLDTLQPEFPELTLQIVKWHLQGQRRRKMRSQQSAQQRGARRAAEQQQEQQPGAAQQPAQSTAPQQARKAVRAQRAQQAQQPPPQQSRRQPRPSATNSHEQEQVQQQQQQSHGPGTGAQRSQSSGGLPQPQVGAVGPAGGSAGRPLRQRRGQAACRVSQQEEEEEQEQDVDLEQGGQEGGSGMESGPEAGSDAEMAAGDDGMEADVERQAEQQQPPPTQQQQQQDGAQVQAQAPQPRLPSGHRQEAAGAVPMQAQAPPAVQSAHQQQGEQQRGDSPALQQPQPQPPAQQQLPSVVLQALLQLEQQAAVAPAQQRLQPSHSQEAQQLLQLLPAAALSPSASHVLLPAEQQLPSPVVPLGPPPPDARPQLPLGELDTTVLQAPAVTMQPPLPGLHAFLQPTASLASAQQQQGPPHERPLRRYRRPVWQLHLKGAAEARLAAIRCRAVLYRQLVVELQLRAEVLQGMLAAECQPPQRQEPKAGSSGVGVTLSGLESSGRGGGGGGGLATLDCGTGGSTFGGLDATPSAAGLSSSDLVASLSGALGGAAAKYGALGSPPAVGSPPAAGMLGGIDLGPLLTGSMLLAADGMPQRDAFAGFIPAELGLTSAAAAAAAAAVPGAGGTGAAAAAPGGAAGSLRQWAVPTPGGDKRNGMGSGSAWPAHQAAAAMPPPPPLPEHLRRKDGPSLPAAAESSSRVAAATAAIDHWLQKQQQQPARLQMVGAGPWPAGGAPQAHSAATCAVPNCYHCAYEARLLRKRQQAG